MALRFVKSFVIDVKMGDDILKYHCRPMTRADALRLDRLRQGEDGTEQLLSMFDRYVDKVEGAVGEDGMPLDKDTVLQNAFFINANGEAAMEWGARSMPSSDKKGVTAQGN
jgi:hypothetical protein